MVKLRTVFWLSAGALFIYSLLAVKYLYKTTRWTTSLALHQQPKGGREKPWCRLPHLQLYAPDQAGIRKSVEAAPSTYTCTPVDWTYTRNGVFYIKPDSVPSGGNITCHVQYINFATDFESILTPAKIITNGTDIDGNYFRVTCIRWEGGKAERHVDLHAGAAKLPFSDIPYIEAGPDNLNIFLIYFDSVSRPHWHRLLPNTVKYLKEELGGVELVGHNVVGGHTPNALFPILTGHNIDGNTSRQLIEFSEFGKDAPFIELPSSGRAVHGSVHVDVYPFIWKTLRKRGYIPLYAEDEPDTGLFTSRRKGFKEIPMEHYMRTFYLKAWGKDQRCNGGKQTIQHMFDYVLDVLNTYSPRPVFAYLHLSHLSHSFLTRLKSADHIIVDFLRTLKTEGILDKTLLILGSDHGPRFLDLRNTRQGKYEQMSPFSSITLPPWFKVNHPDLHGNLVRNAPMLTTTWDLRETMMHVLDMEGYWSNSTRGVSLIHQVVRNDRTCFMAQIPAMLCSCKVWKDVDPTHASIEQAAATSVEYMNNITALKRHKCDRLELNRIIGARVSRLEDGSTSHEYEVTIETKPGAARYEVRLVHVETTRGREFVIQSETDILRTTRYASMVGCLAPEEKNLVNYCVCKTLVY